MNGFERTARLPQRACTVDLSARRVIPEIGATDVGEDVSGGVVQHEYGGGGHAGVAQPAEVGAHDGLRLALERRPQRRPYLDGVRHVGEVLAHPLDEVRRAERPLGAYEGEGRGFEGSAHEVGDEPGALHRREDGSLACHRALGVAERVEATRALRQADKKRGLGERQVARRLSEVGARRGLDAARVVAERDVAQPERQDLGFAAAEF